MGPKALASSSTEGAADELVERGTRAIYPVLTTLGTSGIAGLCVAIATKRASSALATHLGVAFASLQLLAYNDIVTVHYDALSDKIGACFDLDGDGEFTADDLRGWLRRALRILTTGLPRSGAFCAGIYLGLAKM